MILNTQTDYCFNTAKLVTEVTETYQDFTYNYFAIVEPIEEALRTYYEKREDGGFYPTYDIIIDDEKTYYTREIATDENNEPILKEFTENRKIEIKFSYAIVDPADLSQQFLLDDLPGKSEVLVIKTDDNISPKKYSKESKDKLTDRVLIDNKFYTISNVYKELKHTSNTMFGSPTYTTFLVLGG